jgi:segregation and condensation protein A
LSGIIDEMALGSLTYSTHIYSVSTPVYEGPLDLLLQLIERAELDITKLALAHVTDQYLAHLRNIPEHSTEDVSAFLVIASRLIQIKSEMLLPRPPIREQDEEDPGETLARQLRLYKRFKEIANYLAEIEAKNLRTYPRIAPLPKIEASLDLSGLTIDDLMSAALAAFIRTDSQTELGRVVSAPRITIREKIGLIAGYLRKRDRGNFKELFSGKPFKLDIVVTFLALLELVKRSLIQAYQEELFGEIQFESSAIWDEDDTFELEFGE